jgi:hypothetical protein
MPAPQVEIDESAPESVNTLVCLHAIERGTRGDDVASMA